MAIGGYYFGPWAWEIPQDDLGQPLPEEGFWRPPEGALSGLDLRPTAACAARESHPQNWGIFPLREASASGGLKEPYVLLGESLDAELDPKALDAVCAALKIAEPPKAATVRELLVALLTTHADPLDVDRRPPVLPTRDGMLLLMGPNELIASRPFEGESDPAWPNIRKRLQENYRALRESALGGPSPGIVAPARDLYRVLLGTWAAKCKVDPRLLIPHDLPPEVPLPPSTTLTENFNQADSTTLGPLQTWTEYWLSGTDGFRTVSNRVQQATASSTTTITSARAEADLSSDDHSVKLTLVSYTVSNGKNIWLGPAGRFAADAHTCYAAGLGQRNTTPGTKCYRVWRMVAGTQTVLTTTDYAWSANDVMRLDLDGGTLTFYVNDVQQYTNGAVEGNVRAGLGLQVQQYSNPINGDDWSAEDVAAPVTVSPVATQSLSQASAPAISQTHQLSPVATQSLSQATTPAISQSHLLSASATQSLSQVMAPVISQTHQLTASASQSLSEASAPDLAFGTIIDPCAVESASQVWGPGISQTHLLTAAAVESLSEAGVLILMQEHQLWPAWTESLSETELMDIFVGEMPAVPRVPPIEGLKVSPPITGKAASPTVMGVLSVPAITGTEP